jgi:hypothetical protein
VRSTRCTGRAAWSDRGTEGRRRSTVTFERALRRSPSRESAPDVEGLKKTPGVKIWTNPDPAASAAIVTLQPGNADPNKLAAVLYEKEKIACMARTGAD